MKFLLLKIRELQISTHKYDPSEISEYLDFVSARLLNKSLLIKEDIYIYMCIYTYVLFKVYILYRYTLNFIYDIKIYIQIFSYISQGLTRKAELPRDLYIHIHLMDCIEIWPYLTVKAG